jgi:hypothetical protein
MSHVLSRPLVPVALFVAMLAFLAVASLASADSPRDAMDACLDDGGTVIEMLDEKDRVVSTTCYYSGQEAWHCDWKASPNKCKSMTGVSRDGLNQPPGGGALDGRQSPSSGVSAPGSAGALDGGR